MVLASLLVINLGYEFSGTGKPLREFAFVSRALGGGPAAESARMEPGGRFGSGWFGAAPVPVPAEYLRGIDVQRSEFERGHPSYLAGQWQHHGWWYYYLYGLAVKVPLGVWGLVLWSVGLTLARWRGGRWADDLTLWLPALAVLTLVSSQTGFNHHLRYVLPMYPFVAVSVGKLACFPRAGHWAARALLAALVLWAAGSSLAVHPHYLSYFNEVAGGPNNGHNHLVDSNIDWGQDLLFLKAWLDQHPEARPLGLAYFNFIDPQILGIDYRLPPKAPGYRVAIDPKYLREFGPHPGYYALDVFLVRGGSFSIPNGNGGLAPIELHEYEYFRHFRPIAKAGYSIFIYHITPEEADAVRRELGLPLLREQDAVQEDTP